MPHEQPLPLRHYGHETNQAHRYQGQFRRAPLHLPSLRRALAADARYSAGLPRHLLITCLDQTPAGQLLTTGPTGALVATSPAALPALLGTTFTGLLMAHGPTAATVQHCPAATDAA